MSKSLIIKKQPSDAVASLSTPRGIIKRNVAYARAEVHRLINDAQHEATRVRSLGESEAHKLRAAAYREGTEESIARFKLLIKEARELRDRTLAEAEEELLRLSVRIAEKIIGRELKLEGHVVAEIISTAVKNARHLKRGEEMIIRVNALDLAIVEEHRSQLDTANRFASLEIVGDSVGVKRGGCLISTENGSIDAQLETQLQGIERALLEMRNNQTPVIPAATTTTALA